YEAQLCIREFCEKFPNVAVIESNFLNTVSYLVRLFRETGSIHRKSGSRRPTKRTSETVENVREIMQGNPHTFLKRLITGGSIIQHMSEDSKERFDVANL
ncbi:hypothetical protein BDFB_015258, partial [Asbolus verrucosus]